MPFVKLCAHAMMSEPSRPSTGHRFPEAILVNRSSIGWKHARLLKPGIIATIDRARREGIDLIIEGVHINPSERLLRSWREAGGIAIGLVMTVGEEDRHRSRIRSRDAHSFRRADRYLAAFPRIRSIQNGLIERAKIASWPVVDLSRVSKDTERIKHLMDLAWNEHTQRVKRV